MYLNEKESEREGESVCIGETTTGTRRMGCCRFGMPRHRETEENESRGHRCLLWQSCTVLANFYSTVVTAYRSLVPLLFQPTPPRASSSLFFSVSLVHGSPRCNPRHRSPVTRGRWSVKLTRVVYVSSICLSKFRKPKRKMSKLNHPVVLSCRGTCSG